MGLSLSKSSSVTEVPRYAPPAGGAPAAAAPTPAPRVSVSNQALPAASGTESPPPSPFRRPEWQRHLSAIVGATRYTLGGAILDGRITTGLREASLQGVFVDVMAAHWAILAAASAANPRGAEPGQTGSGPAIGPEISVQDIYTPEQIRASRDLGRRAYEGALGRCRLPEKILTRWRQADNTPGVTAVRAAGFLLMDPALPVPLRTQLIKTLQAYAGKGVPSGIYTGGKDGTWSALKKLKALEKTIAEVAEQAHLKTGDYEGLQRVLLDRMMPALLEGIQRRFPGTDLQTAVTQLPRFVNARSLELWQSQVIGMARSDDLRAYERVEQMAMHFITLPDLLDEAVIEGAR